MKISERTIDALAQIITGDKGISPYRTGPKLVKLFNEFGTNAVYARGFPSRASFAENCIRKFNNTPMLKKVILSAVDPRDYIEAQEGYKSGVWTDDVYNLNEVVAHLNEYLSYDGFEIVSHGRGYDIRDIKAGEILFEHELDPNELSHKFISEQIDKCRTKISQGDFDGTITNARSLVEAVLTKIEKDCDPAAPAYDGDLPKLYKRVQKHLNLAPDNKQITENLKQTLRGFVNIINGLAGLSNKMGDRHVREYQPVKHHASLIVNSAMTLCNFIFDTYAYQNSLKKK